MSSSKRFAVCPGSLVPGHWHDEALLDLLGSRLNSTMINFVACKVVETVRCRPSHGYPTPPESPSTEAKKPVAGLPPLASFIKAVVKKSRCHVPTLLASAVYLERLRTRLPSTAQGCPTTRHRCALAAIVIAAKYLNDSSPMNKHWARYSDFSLAEINLMEMQLLAIFNFDLRFDERELVSVLRPLLQAEKTPVRYSMPPSAKPRTLELEEQQADPATSMHADVRRDEVVSRGRHYSVDAAAFAAEETGESGKQLTPAYQRATGISRPRGPLPSPPPPVPPPPRASSVHHRVSYPRHRRPGSTTPLSSPPPLLDDFTTLYSSSSRTGDTRYSFRSSYSSSSTLSSTSSSSFGPRTPFTPGTDLAPPPPASGSHSQSPPIPRVPIPPPKGSDNPVLVRQRQHHSITIKAIPPFSWSSSSDLATTKSKKLSPALSFAEVINQAPSGSGQGLPISWSSLNNNNNTTCRSSSSSSSSSSSCCAVVVVDNNTKESDFGATAAGGGGGDLTLRRLRRRRDVAGHIGTSERAGHVRDRYIQDDRTIPGLTVLAGQQPAGIEVN
ncbi:hypothetical protein JCM3766R1_005303 [Sporobolomyces carnicolor]